MQADSKVSERINYALCFASNEFANILLQRRKSYQNVLC